MEERSYLNLLDKFKIPIAISLVGLVLIIGGLVSSKFGSSISSDNSKSDLPKESLVSVKKVSVDVSGGVSKPGVYDLNSDARVEDAILAAGGVADNANKEYISKYLNMAQKISDGMKIYVPFEGETGVSGTGSAGVVAGASSQVNINSATQSELEALPGIGPVAAAKIIGGRPFQKIEDLLSQKIVSKSTFEKIKSLVVTY